MRKGRAPLSAVLDLRQELREARRSLRRAINSAKVRAWKELLQTLDADPWDRPYQMVIKRMRAPVAPTCETLSPDLMDRVIAGLFPVRVEDAPSLDRPMEDWDPAWDIMEDEVAAVVKKLGRKAPGPDGIPGMVIRRTAEFLTRVWAHCFTLCMREGVFLSAWKVA